MKKKGKGQEEGEENEKKYGRTICKVRHQNGETKMTKLKAVLKLGQDFVLCQRTRSTQKLVHEVLALLCV